MNHVKKGRWLGISIAVLFSLLLFSVGIVLASASPSIEPQQSNPNVSSLIITGTAQITGTIVMDNGDTPDYFNVYAYLDIGVPPPFRANRQAAARNAISTTTNSYTAPVFEEGMYIVEAYVEHQGQSYTVYYDGAADSFSATPVFVPANGTVTDINFVIPIDTNNDSTGTIIGTVYDEVSGNPISNIIVTANSTDTIHFGGGYTDSNGQYTMTVEAGHSYYVKYEDYTYIYQNEYYDDALTEFDATPIPVEAGVTVTLNAELASNGGGFGGGISGTVQMQDGTPLDSFCVYANPTAINPPPVRSADERTPSSCFYNESDYLLTNLLPNEYIVEVEAWVNGHHIHLYYENSPSFDGATSVMVLDEVVPNINFVLEENGGGELATISGVVTDGAGNPVTGIEVAAQSTDFWFYYSQQTDTDGSYALLVPEGEYKVGFWAYDGSYTHEYYDDVSDWESATTIAISASETISNVNASLSANGSISGTVVMYDGNAPDYFWVSYYPATTFGLSRTVEFAGQHQRLSGPEPYVITGVPAGDYIIQVGADYQGSYFYEYFEGAYSPEDATVVQVMDGVATGDINFEIGSGLTSISGQVTGADGNPLADINVSLWSDDYINYASATTDANGDYQTLVSADSYYVYFNDHSGTYLPEFYEDAEFEADATLVVVSETNVIDIDAQLGSGASISGTVVMNDGNPPDYFDVYVTPAISNVRSSSIDTSSKLYRFEEAGLPYQITGLTPGDYWVEAYAYYNGGDYHEYYGGAFTPDEAEILTVADGEQLDGIDFVFGANLGLLEGVVTNQNGDPLAGVEVNVSADTYWSFFTTQTDSSGAYSLTLPPDNYYIQFNDYSGLHQSEWYDDAQQQSSALLVEIDNTTPFVADAVLNMMGAISGTVEMFDGNAPDWFYVSALPASDYQPIRAPDSSEANRSSVDSQYTIAGLVDGNYIVEVFADYQGVYYHAYFDAAIDPSTATFVPVTVGQVTDGVNFTLGADLSFITGNVTDAENNPLVDIDVMVESPADDWSRSWTQTDANGDYQIALPAGEYYIRYEDYAAGRYASEYYDDAATQSDAALLTVTVGETISDVNAILDELGRISGTVEMFDGNDPDWYNVHVEPIFSQAQETESLFNSRDHRRAVGYEVGGLQAGQYRVSVSALYQGDYYYQYYDNVFLPEDATPVVIEVGGHLSDIDFVMGRNIGSITGQVTDANGNPLANMTVQANSQDYWYSINVTTTATGHYTAVVAPGLYTVHFSDPAGLHAAEFYDNTTNSADAGLVNVTAGNTSDNINATLAQAGGVSGIVTLINGAVPDHFTIEVFTDPTLPPVAYAYSQDDPQTGFATNSFEITGLTADTYYLGVWVWYNGSGYYRWYESTTDFTQATPVIVQAGSIARNINFVIGADAGTVSGYVTDESGTPLANIQVEAFHVELYPDGSFETWQDTGYATTDENGYYEIFGLSADRYYVAFNDYSNFYISEYYSDTYDIGNAQFVTFTNGVAENINAALSSGGGISGTVTLGAAQLPGEFVGIEVYKYDVSSNSWYWETWGETQPDGSYRIGGLAPGEYRLFVSDFDWAYRPEFYPDAETIEEATSITVTGSDVTGDVDIVLDDIADPVANVGGGGSVTIDPWTGEVIVMIDPGAVTEDIVISIPVVCDDGTIPENVVLIVGGIEYLTTLSDGIYSAVIPADAFDSSFLGADIVTAFDCNGEQEEDDLGEITLFDPSGIVTDKNTGEVIEGATVTLYQVTNWLPDTAQETRNCRTIGTRGGDDWSQVPDATRSLGVAINDENGRRNGQPLIDPFVNPQITGADGRYGWNVAEGCWYVVVEADGHETRVSPVVGVPPEVTDLDLTIVPFAPVSNIALSATDVTSAPNNVAVAVAGVTALFLSMTIWLLRRRMQ